MSLKAFHVIFIAASILLAFGFGIWALNAHASEASTANLVMGIASLLSGVVLIEYGRRVLKKLKNISYL
jgi:hypothetical protein